MARKVRLVLILILLFSLLSGGCWNRRELDQLAIVSAVALDKEEDGRLKLTAQIIKSPALKKGDGGGGGKAFYVLSSSGDTVFEAIRNFVTESGRKLYYPHTVAIVLGGKLSREGVTPYLDFFLRDHELRLRTWVLVTDGMAADIVKVASPMESVASQQLDMMLKDYKDVSKSVAVNLLDFTNQVVDESLQPVLGRIELKESGGKKSLNLEGAGVFRKDKLVGWLDPIQARGYLWVKGSVKSGIINVTCTGNESRLVALEIKKAGSKIKPYLENGALKYKLEVKVESNVGEQACQIDLANPQVISSLEEEQSRAVEQEVRSVIDAAQKKYKADIFGLGAQAYRKFPKAWKEIKEGWEEKFPETEVEVTVDSRIKRVGQQTMLQVNK